MERPWKKTFRRNSSKGFLTVSRAAGLEGQLVPRSALCGHQEQWQTGVVAPLFKKGNQRVRSNYNGITLNRIPGKSYARCVGVEIPSVSRTSDSGRTGCGTLYQPYILARVLWGVGGGIGTFPNQSTCDLWTWKRLMIMYYSIVCQVLVEYGVSCYGPFSLCIIGARA